MKRLRILTWHVHGNYLYYLSHVPHDFYVPVKEGRPAHYPGLTPGFPWNSNMHEVRADEVAHLPLDVILFQHEAHYASEQEQILSSEQHRLPRVFLEHDPPQQHPTNTRHPVDDPDMLLVHVTPFNALMWDSGRTPTRVIQHGVVVDENIRHTGELARGIAVVNHLRRRGRRLGSDVFEIARATLPIDLVGMGAEDAGGLGEIPHAELAAFEARYRFFFNPIRYTSLGLAVCEAMMIGLPVVGLATTEMASVIVNGVTGFISTDLDALFPSMRELLADPPYARRLGENGRRYAREHFAIDRFVDDWQRALADATGNARASAAADRAGTRERSLRA